MRDIHGCEYPVYFFNIASYKTKYENLSQIYVVKMRKWI